MKILRTLVLASLALVLACGPLQADELADYQDKVAAALTKDKIQSMMAMAQVLRDAGASYQDAYTVPTVLAQRYQPGESLRVMIGIYQFDALYSASFGRKKEAVDFLAARTKLVDKMNLRGQVDVSALFPKKLDAMMKNPESATLKGIIAAYAENADMYREMMDKQIGFETIEASLYGFVLEGLYVTSNSILASGMDPEVMAVLQHVVPLIQPAISLYESFTDLDNYATYVDPDNFLEVSERSAWLKVIVKMIADRGGKLTEKQVRAIAEIVTKERAAVLAVIR